MAYRSKYRKKSNWTLETTLEMIDRFKVMPGKPYLLGALLSRASSDALRSIKKDDTIITILQRAAQMELNLRRTEEEK